MEDENSLYATKVCSPNHSNVVRKYEKLAFPCKTCDKRFGHNSSLHRHAKICLTKKRSAVLVCPVCSVSYAGQDCLKKHKCNPDSSKHTKCLQPGCELKFYLITSMVRHLEEDHALDSSVKSFKCTTFEEFEEWKKSQDKNNFMSTVLQSGKVKKTDTTYSYYICNFRAKRRKGRGPGKIPNFNCPARILLRQTEEGYHCRYLEIHNHPLEPENLKFHRYDEDVYKVIKSKISEGVPAKKIQEYFQPPADGQPRLPEKQHGVKLKEMKNLKYKMKIAGLLNTDDATAVNEFVRKMKPKDSILIYKPQKEKVVIGPPEINDLEDSEDLFILGFQNERMRQEMFSGCSRILCIDSTQKINAHKFHLVNLMVPDEFGRGYPVAHFILSNMESKTLEYVFLSLKRKFPTLKINALMEADDHVTWSAFNKIFPGVAHYLCLWYVDRVFKEQLLKHVKDTKMRREIYVHLTNLIEEKNSSVFKLLLKNFIKTYSRKPETYSFVAFFEEAFSKRAVVWAKCFWNKPLGGIDTSMFYPYHSGLKGPLYLNRRFDFRLETLIPHLEKFEECKAQDLDNARRDDKAPRSFKISNEYHDRRKNGKKIPDDKVKQVSETEWTVTSSKKGSNYNISLFSNECPIVEDCSTKCDCDNRSCSNLCMHMYLCSCPNKFPICKHIHKLHSLREGLSFQGVEEDDDMDDSWQPCEESSTADPPVERPNDKRLKECHLLIGELEGYLSESSVQHLLPYVKEKLEELCRMCASEIERAREMEAAEKSILE